MHIHIADQFRAGHSLIHRLDPRTKVALTLLFILTASLVPVGMLWAYVALLALVLTAAVLSGLGAGYVVRRSVIALPFALAAVTLPFTVPGTTLTSLGRLHISVEGTLRFVGIMVKSWVSVQAAILLAAVTAFPDLLWGLRALRIPKPLVAIVGFMYRYMFVISDEALRLIRARAARSGARPRIQSRRNILRHGKVAGGMVGSLMLRSLERSERVYDAMTARGYQGEMRVSAHPHLRRQDYVALAGVPLYLALVLVAAYLA